MTDFPSQSIKLTLSYLTTAQRTAGIVEDAFLEVDRSISKPLSSLDLDFDFSSGRLNGVKEELLDHSLSDLSSSMQREVGASKDYVRGSSSNAPFMPGGFGRNASQAAASKAEAKRLQRDVSAYANVETSPLFDASKSIYLEDSGLAVEYDDSNQPKLLRMTLSQKSEAVEGIVDSLLDSNAGLGFFERLVLEGIGEAKPASDGASTVPTKDDFHYKEAKRELEEERDKRHFQLEAMREIVQDTSRSLSLSSSGVSREAGSGSSSLTSSSSTSVTSYDLQQLQGGKSTTSWLKAAQQYGQGEKAKHYEWAVTERMANIAADFETLVPEPAIVYPFEMDVFQKEAAYHLEQHESVFIGAHTSAGKTVVAEYAIALAMKHGTRAIYTSPIKALSNQKFHDFTETFDDVGIITGDRSVNPDASCLIVTTEILRSMLYKGADLIRDVEWVVFDEVHYINDLERGVVWEEVIIMLPDHVGLIFLSATVPNTEEFAEWVGRVKRKKVFLITTAYRPVPLSHYLYYDKQIYPICNATQGFMTTGHSAVRAAIQSKADKKAEKKAGGVDKARAGGGSSSQRAHFASASSRAGTWANIVKYLDDHNLFPAVAFVFSKKRCMDLAEKALTHMDLTSSSDKEVIRAFINASLSAKLKGPDRDLPQVRAISDLLVRGIGVHHGGLLPIVKEMVEMLFGTGVIKMLFATETFAMGVNMPTRTVVFDSTQKFDGSKSRRDLLPGEYIQMSGRAGRRGLDTVGTVIVGVFDEPPEIASLRHMVTGRATRLESQFRLTYNMILNLLKMGNFRIEDMIKRSFFESTNQKETEMLKQKLIQGKAQLADIEDVACLKPEFASSESPMIAYQSLVAEERALMRRIHKFLVASNHISKFLPGGRVLVVTVPGLPRESLAVVVRPAATGLASNLSVIGADNRDNKAATIRVLVLTGGAGSNVSDKYKVVNIDAASTEIAFVTSKKLKSIEAERIDVAPDDFYISGVIKELDAIRIDSLPGLPPVLDPVKNLDIKDIDFVEMNKSLEEVRSLFATSPCHECEYREPHLTQQSQKAAVESQVTALEFLVSDTNLLMIPEYESRVKVLKNLEFVGQDGVIQLKGRVARELNNCDELLATELIFQNFFQTMAPDEICALLSCFVLEGKTDNEPRIPVALQSAKKHLTDLATKLGALQVDMGVPITPQEYVDSNVQYGLMEVVYEWARARPFHEIVPLTDIQEGSIVRTIVRLDETLRDFKTAAKIIGNVDLALKMEQASELIKRDIVFATSLYISEDSSQSRKGDGSAVVIEDEQVGEDALETVDAEVVEDDEDGIVMLD